jgi:hypothetical protein
MPTPSRRRLLAVIGSSTTATAFAGCNSAPAEGDTATVNPQLRETPSPTPSGPYAGTDVRELPRPRRVYLRNQLHRRKTAEVTLFDGDTTVFSRNVSVPAGGGGVVGRAITGEAEYRVRVTTPDGRDRTTTWRVDGGTGHLGIDIDRGITVRDRYTGLLARQLLDGDTSLIDGRAGRNALVIDNPGGEVAARFTLSGEGSEDERRDEGVLRVGVPAESRVVFPVKPSAATVSARVSASGTVSTFQWRPVSDRWLEVTLSPQPTFRCDLRWRDLWIRNRTDRPRDVRVTIDGTTGSVFDETTRVPSEKTVRRPAAIPPTADYSSTVVADDLTETYTWPGCPPEGPVLVDVADDDVSVTVQPSGFSAIR